METFRPTVTPHSPNNDLGEKGDRNSIWASGILVRTHALGHHGISLVGFQTTRPLRNRVGQKESEVIAVQDLDDVFEIPETALQDTYSLVPSLKFFLDEECQRKEMQSLFDYRFTISGKRHPTVNYTTNDIAFCASGVPYHCSCDGYNRQNRFDCLVNLFKRWNFTFCQRGS
jgi:hypothetical protein